MGGWWGGGEVGGPGGTSGRSGRSGRGSSSSSKVAAAGKVVVVVVAVVVLVGLLQAQQEQSCHKFGMCHIHGFSLLVLTPFLEHFEWCCELCTRSLHHSLCSKPDVVRCLGGGESICAGCYA